VVGGTTSHLDAAVARPRATAFGLDAYPDDYTKAAALMQSLARNYGCVQGNNDHPHHHGKHLRDQEESCPLTALHTDSAAHLLRQFAQGRGTPGRRHHRPRARKRRRP